MDKFRHCYIRYKALLGQLQAEAPGSSDHGVGAPLLRSLQAAAVGGGMAADSAPWLAAGSGVGGPFACSFEQEVQRLRLFLKSSLEALWLALLDACAQLRGLSEELLQARPRVQGRAGRRSGLQGMGQPGSLAGISGCWSSMQTRGCRTSSAGSDCVRQPAQSHRPRCCSATLAP